MLLAAGNLQLAD